MQKKYYVGDHVVTTHHTAFFVADLERAYSSIRRPLALRCCITVW